MAAGYHTAEALLQSVVNFFVMDEDKEAVQGN